jgi:hypothetical protein
MGLTKLNFNEIENSSETNDIININKTTSLNQEVILPTKTPTKTDVDGTIWVDQNSGNLKVKVNSVIYDLSPQTDFNNITINTSFTFPLNGNVGIVNNLTIGGTGTTVNFRSSGTGGAQWSILEIKGDLTIASGCTVNLVRTPLIVRGNISGTGTITSPNGVNGGSAGVGGPGGTGGKNGYYMMNVTPGNGTGQAGSNSPSTWPNINGGSAVSMEVEYGVSSGAGGPGGRGTAGGGGGGYRQNPSAFSGGASGNGNPGGSPYNAQPDGYGNYYVMIGGSGGGAGGAGSAGSAPTNIGPVGPSATGTTGTSGTSAGTLALNYVGIGNSSSVTSGTSGTSGGAGGLGGRYNTWFAPTSDDLPTDGSTGGTGGNGGAGGGTGGAHISIYCAGTISSPITIRPGKGGLTGGSTSLPRAQTGSLWLFTPTGSEPVPGIDLTGGTGTPTGPVGNSNRFALSNGVALSDFFTGILYEASGPTVAKTKIAITYP